MAMTASTFVAGHYTAVYTAGAENANAGAVAIGTTEQGFYLTPTHHTEPVRIDDAGDMEVDGIYRGFSLNLSFTLNQWIPNIMALMFPAHQLSSVFPHIGKNWHHLGGQLVLTPTPGINARLKTYTFFKVRPEGNSGAFSMASLLRKVPLQFTVLLPLDGSNTGQLFKES